MAKSFLMPDPDKRVPIILASSSPRRSELLEMLGVEFSVVPSLIDEKDDPDIPIEELVESNALAKVNDVVKRCDAGLVIGADTVVVCDGKMFGKPADIDDAVRMLQQLEGRTHKVYSGVAVTRAEDGFTRTAHEVTSVTFRPLSKSQIIKYFEMIDPLDKAGAYAIQGAGGIIIEKLSGCYYNVVGLPLTVLDNLLAQFGTTLL
jgi:septum formation protein